MTVGSLMVKNSHIMVKRSLQI